MNLRSIVAVASILFASPSIAGELCYSGHVSKVADGDTFTLENDGQKVRVRFCGVDSPERRQPGYDKASRALGQLTEGKQVRCVQVGGGTPCDGRSRATSRDRIVAQSFVGDEDIAMAMICSGDAKDWPRFSGGYYAACSRYGGMNHLEPA